LDDLVGRSAADSTQACGLIGEAWTKRDGVIEDVNRRRSYNRKITPTSCYCQFKISPSDRSATHLDENSETARITTTEG
jgi:hypothetical protein